MLTTIHSLPQEILIEILEHATKLNLRENPKYTYGLSRTFGYHRRFHTVVRGHLSYDVLRWNATCAIRQVNRRWHDWACHYALKRLYISRWRGSERWIESRTLSSLRTEPSDTAVYQDPYCALKETAQLFRHSPSLTPCVRKIWFDGYYTMETYTTIFEILGSCEALEHVTLPWIFLRYGDAEVWSRLLRRNTPGRTLCSLWFLAIDLKKIQASDPANQVDRKPLDFAAVTFENLNRLKIFGDSNHMALTDSDLFKISRTARNLQEIQVTSGSSITINGVMALANASRSSLRTLQFFQIELYIRRDPPAEKPTCLCQQISQFAKLTDLNISLPTVCPDLFQNSSVNWRGEFEIRASSICDKAPTTASPARQTELCHILDAARALTHAREQSGAQLKIKILMGTAMLSTSSPAARLWPVRLCPARAPSGRGQ